MYTRREPRLLPGKPPIPRFKSEAEEAKWWSDHREETVERMKRAAAEGRTTDLATLRQKRRDSGPTPTVSIRIDPAELSRARILARTPQPALPDLP